MKTKTRQDSQESTASGRILPPFRPIRTNLQEMAGSGRIQQGHRPQPVQDGLPRIQTPEQLYAFIQLEFGLNLPKTSVCPDHDSPWEYVRRSFFEDRDFVVWAGRGAGKSFAAALATVLKALFVPGYKQVIIGGSQAKIQRRCY